MYIACKNADEWYPVYHPIWQAMRRREEAGKLLGLILWEVMYNRPEDWGFHKLDRTIVNEHNLMEDIEVMEYFRIEDFPRSGRWRDALATRRTP
jgi:hypothetical protein